MGQNVNGIMYGARIKRASFEKVAALLGRYENKAPDFDEDRVTVGYWIAVRNGDDPAVPNLAKPVALDAVPVSPPYAKAHAVAVSRWGSFAIWAAGQGVALPSARMWITTTEVA